MDDTPQSRGRALDYEIAKMIGGHRVAGSGAGFHKLDARGRTIALEAKYTDSQSFRVTNDLLDKIARAVMGPESPLADVEAFLVIKIGPNGRPKAVIDFELLLEWMKSPPEIVPSTSQDAIRATARRPSLLRD